MHHGGFRCSVGRVRCGITSRPLFRLAQAGYCHIQHLLGLVPWYNFVLGGQLVQGDKLVSAGNISRPDLRQLQDNRVVILQMRGKGSGVESDLGRQVALLRARMMRLLVI